MFPRGRHKTIDIIKFPHTTSNTNNQISSDHAMSKFLSSYSAMARRSQAALHWKLDVIPASETESRAHMTGCGFCNPDLSEAVRNKQRDCQEGVIYLVDDLY